MITIDNYQIRYCNFHDQADQAGNPPEEQLSLLTKVAQVSLAILYSLAETTLITAGQLKQSFQYRVLGFNGTNWNISFSLTSLVFKTAIWAIGTGLFFVLTAFRQLSKNLNLEETNDNLLKLYASKDINLQHLTEQRLSIDVTDVPETVRTNDLLTIFDEINFTDPSSPGYMAPSTREEDGTTYSIPEIRTALSSFIEHVNQRIPFIGTPPAYDTLKLESFYKQIEDATRFSIHKLKQALTDFRARHGTNLAAYSPEVRRKYSGLLEDQFRLAIDLGIAGKHCGARYMGDVMDTYFLIKGDAVSDESATLQGILSSLLANKRKEIANRHIATHLGNAHGLVDTHTYTAYMQSVGKIVGIPGTEHVSEFISSLNPVEHLQRFFQEYTVDYIISSVKEELKKEKNLSLRTAFADTIVDNLSETDPESLAQETEDLVRQIKEALHSATPAINKINTLFEDRNTFDTLIDYVRKVDSPDNIQELLTNKDWDALFLQESVKTWFQNTFPRDTLARATKKRALLGTCKIYPALFDLTNPPLSHAQIEEHIKPGARIKAVRELLQGTQEDFIGRLIDKDELSMSIDVQDFLKKKRKEAFKEQLLATLNNEVNYSKETRAQLNLAEGENPENVTPLCSETMDKLLEWVLVSQGIFTPQNLERNPTIQLLNEQLPINPNIINAVITNSDLDTDLVEAILNPEYAKDVIESLAKSVLTQVQSGTRYTISNSNSYKERLLNAIFEKAFANNPEQILNTTESSIPFWKEVTLIMIPQSIGYVLDSSVVKTALTITFLYQTFVTSYWIYEEIPGILAGTVNSLAPIFRALPTPVLEAGQSIVEALDWVNENRLKALFGAFICQTILADIGRFIGLPQVYQDYIDNFSVWDLLLNLGNDPFSQAWNLFYENLLIVWNLSGDTAAFFQNIANKTKEKERESRQERAYADWSQATRNLMQTL